jgi:guanine deaminase
MAGSQFVSGDSSHRHWLDAVITRATDNVAAGGGPFAALVVRHGEILSEGVNRVARDVDPTAHAEVVAIRAACRAVGDFSLDGCLLVSSCEPCPLCLSAALWARVDQLVYVADRHDAARAGFDDLAFYEVLDKPRDEWPLLIEQRSLPSQAVPFDAWLAKADRVAY